MFRRVIVLFVLLIPLSAMGYGSSLTSLASPYKKILRKYTRKKAVYSIVNFDTTYRWYATYHSKEFRQAVLERFDKFYPEGQDGLANKLISQKASPGQTEFFVALYAKERGLKRMTGDKNLWDISLIINKEVFKPILIERINLTPFQFRFYPYLDKWYFGYRVIFPASLSEPLKKQAVLQMSSVAGVSQVTF